MLAFVLDIEDDGFNYFSHLIGGAINIRMTLGLTSSVGIQKCSTSSGYMKFSVAPLSMSAFTSEWIVLEWNLTGAWTYFCLGM